MTTTEYYYYDYYSFVFLTSLFLLLYFRLCPVPLGPLEIADCLQAERPSCHPTNSVNALKECRSHNETCSQSLMHTIIHSSVLSISK